MPSPVKASWKPDITPTPMRLLTLTLLLAGLAGCTTRMLYDTAQQTQLAECRKIADIDAQRRCIQRNSTSYDSYKAQSEAAAAKP